MRRKLLTVLLLPLAACQDTPTGVLAPEAASFVRVSGDLLVEGDGSTPSPSRA